MKRIVSFSVFILGLLSLGTSLVFADAQSANILQAGSDCEHITITYQIMRPESQNWVVAAMTTTGNKDELNLLVDPDAQSITFAFASEPDDLITVQIGTASGEMMDQHSLYCGASDAEAFTEPLEWQPDALETVSSQ